MSELAGEPVSSALPGARFPAPVSAYREPPRSYASALALVAVLAVGFVIDLLLGGGVAHLWGWLLALVLIVGVDWLVVYAARSTRTIVLDADALSVGEDSVARAEIAAVEPEIPEDTRVLGMPLTNALPRGTAGLALRMLDGEVVTVPTRHPSRLATVLQLGTDEAPIREATEGDLALLVEISTRADTVFRIAGYDLPHIEAAPPWLDAAEVVLVVGSPAHGYASVGEADGNAHLEELAVVPGQMRRGLGRRLVESACAWAVERGYPAVTLTTYADVPWNAPWYARLGFEIVEDFGADVRERRDWERSVGLDAVGRRVVMRRPL